MLEFGVRDRNIANYYRAKSVKIYHIEVKYGLCSIYA